MFFRCFRRFSAQPGCLWTFTRRAPKVTSGKLELATPGLASTGSPSWTAPRALISMCREGGLEGRLSLCEGAGWWARGDLGSCDGHTWGLAVNREIGSLRCFHWRGRDPIFWMTAWGSVIAACGGLAESWIPHNFGFLLKAKIWQLLLEKSEESRRSVDKAGMLWEASGRPELRVSPMRVHTLPLSIKALPPPPNLGLRAHFVLYSLSSGTSAGMPSWCPKDQLSPHW